jgi:hypothetical protein
MSNLIRTQEELATVTELKFDNPTAAINLETLRNSATHLLVGGSMPSNRPVQHYDLLTWLHQMYEDTLGKEMTMSPIHISARHSKRIRTSNTEIISPKDPCPIERLNINRLVTTIYDPNRTIVGGEEFVPSIAVSYTEKGIEVALGVKAWACANMNIFGQTRWATHGKNKVSFEDMKTLIKSHLVNSQLKFEQDLETIERLQSNEISFNQQRYHIAELFEAAVDNNFKKKKDSILNISQTVKLTEEIILKRKNLERELTYWDFTQAGTEHLKGDSQDMVSLLPTIEQFNNYVLEQI